MSGFDEIFNELPLQEREKLMPFLISEQIIHYEQCKMKAIKSHKALISDYNSHINNLKTELKKSQK